jgi:mannose-1-phosphate guanylyltransferase
VTAGARQAPVTTALVLAAGRSTRIQAAVDGRPKPLIEVGGQSVLERNLRQLAAAGVRTAWINLHYESEQIRAAIGDGHVFGLDVQYSYEPELLGTAGAAKNIERFIGVEPFFVVYGDNLVSVDLHDMTGKHRASRADATIAVFDRDRVPNTGLAGGRVAIDEGGYIVDFREGGGTSPYVNAGVYVLEPSVLASIPAGRASDFGHDVFPSLLRSGRRLQAYSIDGYCLGIDTPDGLARARALLERLELRQTARPA